MRRAVFFDRDGVLTKTLFDAVGKPLAPRRLEDFVIEAEAAECVRQVRESGFLAIVVTNQPDVGNGLVSQGMVERMHDLLRAEVGVDDIEVCYATRKDHSPRMKPAPGMILDAAKKWGIDLVGSVLIGDRSGDILAGKNAGCGLNILIERHYPEPVLCEPDFRVESLTKAVDKIVSLSTTETRFNHN